MRGSFSFHGIAKGELGDQLTFGLQAAGHKSPDQPNAIRVMVALKARLQFSQTKKALADTHCEFSLDYSLTDPDQLSQLTEEDLIAFASTSGVYNAWPYMREFCHNLTARMPVPTPMILPTLAPEMLPTARVPWGDFGELGRVAIDQPAPAVT
jgi:hypothetical protein